MKKHQRISILLTCLLLALPLQTAVTEPLQINAAEALPAGGITTTVSDSRFIDAGWMNQNIILTLDGQVWAMGINMMKDYPVMSSSKPRFSRATVPFLTQAQEAISTIPGRPITSSTPM